MIEVCAQLARTAGLNWDAMDLLESETQLEDALSTPSRRDVAFARELDGDVVILGAGGKMGPSLAKRIRRACDEARVQHRVIAVSRFESGSSRSDLERAGVQTTACDLLDTNQVSTLPDAPNVLFLAGRKFGSSDRSDLTWAMNTILPANVAPRLRHSRVVVFSTGNVYPFVTPAEGGCTESTPPAPCGEYAQSCLGRERIFEYFSREQGLRCLLFRLNYAVDLRYGVLVDIARRVRSGERVSLAVPAFNAIWQGDANSYAFRSLGLCDSPPRYLNVTGPETLMVRQTAEFFANRFGRDVEFGDAGPGAALLSNAGACHKELGYPEVAIRRLMDMVAHWVEIGGASLAKPTKFEVTDGRF
jgi:nucleoside-diphosphate-sugar epimerase